MKQQKGFTLIEYLVVIAIIGIIASISIPRIRAFQPSWQLRNVVRQVVTDLRYAQQMAVTEQIEHAVYFISDLKQYQIRRYGATTSILKTVSWPEEIIEVILIGLSEADSNKEARYNPYGAVRENGSVTLKNTKDETKTILVKPSGFVKITD